MNGRTLCVAALALLLACCEKKDDVQSLIEKLKDDAGAYSTLTIKKLGETGDKRALAPLKEALQSADPVVRSMAVEAMAELGFPEAVPSLVPLLEDEVLGPHAVKALQKLGDDAIPALVKALGDARLRERAGEALAALEAKAVAPCIEALRDEETREGAVAVLARMGDHAAGALEKAVSQAELREAAADALEKMGERGEGIFVRLLKSGKEPETRALAAVRLGRMRGGSALNELIPALQDESETVRIAAAHGLRLLEDKAAVPPLIEALRDESGEVRTAALEALYQVAKQKIGTTYKAWKGWLDSGGEVAPASGRDADKVFAVREYLRENLARLAKAAADARSEGEDAVARYGSAALEPVTELLAKGEPGVRRFAAVVLGKIGNPESVESLLPLLKDDDEGVRDAAATALGSIGDSRAVPPLFHAARDGLKNSKAAFPALLRFGDKGVDTLVRLLEDTDEKVRLAAITALKDARGTRMADAVVKAMSDGYTMVRFRAVQLCERLPRDKVVPPLIAALEDADKAVRDEAERTLGRIAGEKLGADPAAWKAWWERQKK